MTEKYTVWVGGSEMNDYYLSLSEAQTIAQQYITDGYDDVIIERVQPWETQFTRPLQGP